MKNLITLKKFCLVVAIVGLLHTIVDAESKVVRYDDQYINKTPYNTGSVVATTTFSPITSMTSEEALSMGFRSTNNNLFENLLPTYGSEWEWGLEVPIARTYGNVAQYNYSSLVETLLNTYGSVILVYKCSLTGEDYMFVDLTMKFKDGKCLTYSNVLNKKNSNN